MREEYRQRLAKEYRYAVTKMQETQPAKKLYYFSVFFAEAQRVLNWEWNRDLALIYVITQYLFTQMSEQASRTTLPVNWTTIFDKLTQATSDLASYFEKNEDKEALYQILGRLAEITYAISGNGSYLHEKEVFKL